MDGAFNSLLCLTLRHKLVQTLSQRDLSSKIMPKTQHSSFLKYHSLQWQLNKFYYLKTIKKKQQITSKALNSFCYFIFYSRSATSDMQKSSGRMDGAFSSVFLKSAWESQINLGIMEMVHNHQRLQHSSPGAGNKQWMQNVGLAFQTSPSEGMHRRVCGELHAIPKWDPCYGTNSWRITIKISACA